MKFWKKIEKRREADFELQEEAGVKSNPPVVAGITQTYSPADIERLEEERAPWLRKRRRR